ncbi:MAG: HAMP domain-containing sensor histidine kinase [Cyanobium sp. LacPavin_0920_WC12_MAG_62_9]|nr:HAMP domain-containing sensor histidine kinase [Cyanobium sp. LacPavin_0920_WC12_MAG_62_9]
MKQRSSWRQHLFGSIEGQLKLATGLVLLLGFSIASLGTLLVTRQNLVHDLEADSASINRSITGEAKALISLPTLERNRRLLQARERQTNWKHTVWLELADGTDLLPSHSEGSVPPEVIWELVGRHNPSATTLARETQMHDGTTVLSLRQTTPIPGLKIGVAQNITAFSRAINQQVFLLAITWGGALLLSLQITSLLVKRIVKPLRQLGAAAAGVNSETLPQSQILLNDPPLEVAELATAYNALMVRLAHAWQQQQEFVGSVSHELRTPLTIISGYLQRTLRRDGSLTPTQRNDLGIAADETDRMKRLLGDLLTLSRSDCSRLELVRQRIDPLPLLQELVDQSNQALARPIALENHWPRAHGHRQILACPDQLKQVLLNLIENADKYSPKDSPIEVGLLHTLAGSTIQVKDHGDGILPDELPHIFERFYRGSSSHRQAGSGLGLSVVQLLVEAMGAAIQVESNPGQGSCFSLHWRADHPQVPA